MSLTAMKKQNTLDKLLGAVEEENKPLEKKSYVDERLWKPELDKTGMVMQSFVFSLPSRVRNFRGQRSGTMRFKDQLDSGILRILSLLLDRKTLYQK